MERLTIKKENGNIISFDAEDEVIEKLSEYEDTGLEPAEIESMKNNGGWIPVSERLPEEKENLITRDFYEYQVTAKFGDIFDIRHYKYGRGKWWNGGSDVTDCVIAWQPLPEPYRPQE